MCAALCREGERVLLEGAVYPGLEMEAMLFDVPFVYDPAVASSVESDVKRTTLNSGWKVPKSNLDEIPYGSGSLIKYVAIAVNACDAFVHYKPWTFSMNVWDHAAGVLCCEEAGAIVSDGFGNRLVEKETKKKRRRFRREMTLIQGACFRLKEKPSSSRTRRVTQRDIESAQFRRQTN